MVAVGGARRGSKAKKPTLSRYLRPKTASCHDSCKHGATDEGLEIKRPSKRLGSRKMAFDKNKGVKRTVEPVERKKTTKTKPKRSPEPQIRPPVEPVQHIKREILLSSKKVEVSKQVSSTNRKVTQKEIKTPINRPTNVKTRTTSSSVLDALSRLNGQKTEKDVKTHKHTQMVPKSSSVEDHKPVSPLKEQNAEKVKEMTKMTFQEAEAAKTDVKTESNNLLDKPVSPLKDQNAENDEEMTKMTLQEAETVEIDATAEPNNILDTDNTQASSDNRVSNLESEDKHTDDEEVFEEECENGNNEEVITYEDNYEMENCNYRVVDCQDGEDEELEVKFRRGKVIEPESDDNGPWRLKFRRGTVLDNNRNQESESVTLKHQEQKEKEAQELLNRLIEEKASKLAEDRKTKVGALVGAFETVISLQDDTPSSES